MTAIYSNSTPIQSGSSHLNADLDASQRPFDVYEAYQHALHDEEVSLRALLASTRRIFSSRHPDISAPSSDSIAHGACYAF